MKTNIRKWLSCILFAAAATLSVHAENGIIETRHYFICPGDTLSLDNGQTKIWSDSLFYDTIPVANPEQDSIYVNIVTVYPAFSLHETHNLEMGQSFEWQGLTITRPGTYARIYKNVHDCDSAYYLTVIEQLPTTSYYSILDTAICQGDYVEWNGGRYYTSDTVYQKITAADGRDSISVLHLTVYPTFRKTEVVEFDTFPTSYRNTPIPEPGTYTITYKSSNLCDSVYIVQANQRVIVKDEYVTICNGESYEWHYHTYTEGGQYQETVRTQDGLRDSIHFRLHLTVKYIPVTYINHTICAGNTFSFGGQMYDKSGVYPHTFVQDGCDSVVVLSLNVLAVDTVISIHHVPEGTKYHWTDGNDYDAPGVYDFLDTNRFGCDSITRLILTTHHVDTVDTAATICPGETLEWHGIRGRQTHNYATVETLPNGDQVLYRLFLTVKELKYIEETFSICSGQSVTFNGVDYSEAGTYDVPYSCDTIYHLVITKNAQQVFTTQALFDGVTPYIWTYTVNGQTKTKTVTAADTYEEYYDNPETGCRDTYRLILREEHTSYHFEEALMVCEGEDFVWHGKHGLSSVGVGTTTDYYAEYTTVFGEDSIYHLALTVNPVLRSSRTIRFCGETTFRGKTYTESAIVEDTVASQFHCDSIIRIYLDKVPSYFFHDTATITQGETLFWHGQEIRTNGLYRDPYTTVYGCDSIYELGVGMIAATTPENIVTTRTSICEGDVYEWRNHPYVNAGTYCDTVKAQNDEERDTVYVLNLTVHPSYTDTIIRHIYACGENAVIRYNGTEYTQDTVVKDTFPTIHGCDSIVKAFLHFNTASFATDTLRISDKDTARVWHGQKIDHAGTYYYDEPAGGECFHREELVVFIYQTYLFVKDTAICQNEAPYIWPEAPDEYKDREYSHEPGTTKSYTYTYQTVNGFDSIYQLNLTIYPVYESRQQIRLCEGDEQEFFGKIYTFEKPDSIYRDTIHTHSMFNCDSIIYVEVIQSAIKRHRSTRVIHVGETIDWNEQTLTSGGKYTYTGQQAGNGCDSIEELILIEEDRLVKTACYLDLPVEWRNKEFNTSGMWTDTVWNQQTGEMEEFHSLYLTVITPVDTTIFLRGCLPEGVTFNDVTYTTSTVLKDVKIECDTIYTVHIDVDTNHVVELFDTICEVDLPYVLGRQKPELLWDEGYYEHKDTTACGCDSLIKLRLTIRPNLVRSDSVIVCERDLAEHPYVLGELEHPWFENKEDGKYKNLWQGNWTGLKYTKDTIIYDCDGTNFFHLIVKPQPIQDSVYYLCEGDSIRFGYWPDKSPRWLKEAGVYWDTLVSSSSWLDTDHNIIYDTDTLLCDSLIRLSLFTMPTYRDTIERHIPYGDTIRWNNEKIFHTGYYDSISNLDYQDTKGEYCHYVHYLHLIVDSVYMFHDTISICAVKNKTLTHTWFDGHSQTFNVPDKDSLVHYYDKLVTEQYHFDSIYDLYVLYSMVPDTTITRDICEGDYITFLGQDLTEQGSYPFTLTAANGCDSLVTLNLIVHPHEIKVENKTIFEGESVTFNNESYSTSGVYEKTNTNEYGCLVIERLVLTVVKPFHRDTSAVVCESDLPFVWHDLEFNGEGDFDVVTSSTDSSRVVTTLHLKVNKTFYGEKNVSLCEGSTFIYKNKEYRTSGSFFDTIPTTAGCDSIIKIIISVHPTYDRIDTVHISDKQTYEFNGRTLFTPGTYEASFQTKDTHCDSLVHLVLVVHPSYYFYDSIDICEPDTLFWHGQSITKSGLYSDSALTTFGFDSVYQVKVKVHKNYMIEEKYEIVKGYTTYIHGINISEPGVYFDSLITSHGCDSIYRIVVNWKRVFEQTQVIEMCEGETYDFYGQPLTHTGYYTHVADDGSMIIHLDLTVHPKSEEIKRVVIAKDELAYDNYYLYNGRRYYLPDTYNEFTEQYTNQFHCDSTFRLIFIVTEHYSEWTRIALCQGEQIRVDTMTITESGRYTFLKYCTTTNQWDSIYRVEVYDAAAYDMPDEEISLCDGDTLFYNDRAFTRSGYYTFRHKSIDGCDSITHLNLTVYPTYHYYTDVTITDYQSYRWNGREYFEEGEYERTFTTVHECDSTYILRLTVIPTERVHTEDTICAGQHYSWRGYSLDKAGLYSDTVRVLQTGTSAIYTLQLTVLTPTIITNAVLSETCADVESFDIHFSYTGATPTTYSIYFDQLAKKEGFTDILNQPFRDDRVVHVPMPEQTEVYYLEHTKYVRPDNYSMRMVLDNGVCGYSRSDSLILRIKYPSWIIEQNWNDVVAPLKSDLNGGYVFSKTDWYVNGVLQEDNGLGYLHNDNLREGDEVVMLATRKGESYSIPTCPLVIKAYESVYDNPILVYPTQAPRHAPTITIDSSEAGLFSVYSSTASLVTSGRFEEGKTQVRLPNISGLYIFRLVQGDHVETHKVLLY